MLYLCVSFDVFCNYSSVSVLIGGPVVGVNWVLGGGFGIYFLQRSGVLGFSNWGFLISKLLGRGCAW